MAGDFDSFRAPPARLGARGASPTAASSRFHRHSRLSLKRRRRRYRRSHPNRRFRPRRGHNSSRLSAGGASSCKRPRPVRYQVTRHRNDASEMKRISAQMCRNIRTLYNFEPPATEDEVRAAALQFVRKISGLNKPSLANQAAFDRAVEDVTTMSQRLIDSLRTSAKPRDREVAAAAARARRLKRTTSG